MVVGGLERDPDIELQDAVAPQQQPVAAGDGRTVPLSSSPSKRAAGVTVAMRRRPYGVSPTSVMLGSDRRAGA
jgi:hypothetical protein